MQWQPDGLTIRAKRWLPGAGFLGAPPVSLILAAPRGAAGRRFQREQAGRRTACAMTAVAPVVVFRPDGGPFTIGRCSRIDYAHGPSAL